MTHPVEVRLLEALIPPSGFELESLVGTTYNLNPAVFLAIASAAALDWTSRGGAVGFDSLTKEEWRSLLIEKRQRCLLFMDHHGPLETGAGGLKPLETAALDQVVKRFGRDTGRGGSLHSKLLVALYRNSHDTIVGRVFIGSKNFTGSNMQEFGVVYDLRPASHRQRNRSFTEPLIEYLEYLRDEEARGTRKVRLGPLHTTIELLRRERLCVADDSCQFHWQGRGNGGGPHRSLASQLQPLLRNEWDGIFIHSPWTRRLAVRYFADPIKEVPIRIACLKEPGLSTVNQRNVRYQLSHSASGQVPPHQSHAKIYLFAKQTRSVLVFGSANLTPDGWGIDSPGCRPNAEILVSTAVKVSDYRYLTDIGGSAADIASNKPKPSLQEKVLALINSIDVTVSYNRELAALHYEIRVGGTLEGFDNEVSISHELIESQEGASLTSLPICEGWPLPAEIKVSWPRRDLFRVSSLLRIVCLAHSVETHLIVDLDSEFYEGRANLRALQYKAKELLESLAQLMNVAIPETPPGNGSGDDRHHKQLSALLDGLRIERYAYKMSRLKTRDNKAFRRTLERVNRLLGAAKDDDSLFGDAQFRNLIEAVQAVHGELTRT
jgi:hypothetical protein